MKKIKTIITLAVIIGVVYSIVDLVRFPECYISTWRYQLKNDINQGNEAAIEYYNSFYVEKGRPLFND